MPTGPGTIRGAMAFDFLQRPHSQVKRGIEAEKSRGFPEKRSQKRFLAGPEPGIGADCLDILGGSREEDGHFAVT